MIREVVIDFEVLHMCAEVCEQDGESYVRCTIANAEGHRAKGLCLVMDRDTLDRVQKALKECLDAAVNDGLFSRNYGAACNWVFVNPEDPDRTHNIRIAE